MKARLIIDPALDAYTNMAKDEAIMQNYHKLKIPTLRLYQWVPKAVSIGYFQSLSQEVDSGRCDQLGVHIVRRITGGGAVYHDRELTYSFICDEDMFPHEIQKSYELICGAVVIGLKKYGINAEFKPINDILVNGKKISGSAQTRHQGTLLQHGTIIIDVSVEEMFSLLLVPNEKIKDKLITDVKDRVTSICALNGKCDLSNLTESIIKGFSETLKLEFINSDLIVDEYDSLKKNIIKFKNDSWNHKR